MREQERKADEQRAAKQAADEEWRRQQHEREIQRKLEDEARQKEIKAGGGPCVCVQCGVERREGCTSVCVVEGETGCGGAGEASRHCGRR